MIRIATVLVASIFIMGICLPAGAQAQNRVLLGERHVTDRSERDTINVGKGKGTFTGLQVKAKGAPVEFKRVVVHFENGSEQIFEKNRILKKGDASRVIDLEGGDRFIDKVVFHYEARTKGWKGADMKLWGIR